MSYFAVSVSIAKALSPSIHLQAIKQAYVLVLGLDVLGNPFGLIEGLADGAKGLFYEPIQGAIQGPEEFAEGLALGLRSLLSGTLGMLSIVAILHYFSNRCADKSEVFR